MGIASVVPLRTRRSEESTELVCVRAPFVSHQRSGNWWVAVVFTTALGLACLALEPPPDARWLRMIFFALNLVSWPALVVCLWRERSCRMAWRQWAAEHGSTDLQIAIREGYELGDRIAEELASALLPKVRVSALGLAPHAGRLLNAAVPERVTGPAITGAVPVPNRAAREMLAQVRERISTTANPVPFGTALEVGELSYCWFAPFPCVPVRIRASHGFTQCYYTVDPTTHVPDSTAT